MISPIVFLLPFRAKFSDLAFVVFGSVKVNQMILAKGIRPYHYQV